MKTPEIVKLPTKEVRMWARRVRLHLAGIGVEVQVSTLTIGSGGLGAMPLVIHPDPLTSDSIVYSFGIGQEIGWDMEMISRFGATVYGFDPSPDTVEWAASSKLPEKFIFHPVGLSGHDGTITLYPPPADRSVHYSSINRSGHEAEARKTEVPVKRLGTIAAELGHDHVDLLKIDIDGSEYEALPDVLDSGVPIRQIIIEFHHNFPTLSFSDTHKAIDSMRSHGYKIFAVSRRGREFSLLKQP